MSPKQPSAPQPSTPTGSRREQQKLQTRALILENARCLFEEHGYEKTTMRAVAAQAGVALGTIFAHFPDKRSLLIATLIDDLVRVQERSWATMPQDAPIQEKLLHLAREGFHTWGQRPALARVLLKEMWFIPGPWHEKLKAIDQQALERVTALLEEARQRGELRSDADPALAARATFSCYLGTLLLGLEPETFKTAVMVEEARCFLRQLFTGIGKERT